MNTAVSCDEEQRLAALYQYQILDTPRDPAFDELTELAADLFDAPIAVVNFIDNGRQWFKSEIGLGVRETPLETSFCAHALLQQDMLVVPDTHTDARFANNPLVTGPPNIRFYAGAVLKNPDGYAIGTLCILDYHCREFSESQRRTLRVLANQVMSQLEHRKLLSASKLANKQLSRLNERLEARDRANAQFLAMISHELRNPLSPLTMTLDLLNMKGPFPADISSAFATMRRQTDHLIRLVDDLLDASRIATGKISLEKNSVELSDIVRNSIEIVQPALKAKDHNLVIELPESDLVVHGDTVRLTQAITNLLTNSVRYTPKGGEISVRARALDTFNIQIMVSDSGQGISDTYLERIFDSFVQAPNPKETRGGLGIGLHLCKHIIQMHRGTITASSEGTGKGSTFTVVLPRERKELE
ncbi:GAF domain-containing sensor histidine kinase [Ketobacter sp. MCCC 1A13808]|uniref:GAF domain-containing sensor histidine kinase n=1 Tax=Ketobacter sp. MCCC 1A13808 TaxID=2602738 RepID=UPI000F224B29|nr:GAF domain-containing sensor histidine kinase [Ketobacter sp. MCCC 1A13808]MVF13418.1 GAF domain-containing sensor histidine kinase [Ketobacter sp. MCCC 1A13808]RLP52937.1 MAG: sensor histidine kinase [Ketobacter sp.]